MKRCYQSLIRVFVHLNKIDLFKERKFDDHLPEDVQQELLKDLKQTWMAKSNNNAVFISAETGENLGELRSFLYQKIKKLFLKPKSFD